jgi:hypothetical protein
MNWSLRRLLLILTIVSMSSGCGRSTPTRLATFPVRGKVLVDGQPVDNLAIYCNRLSAVNKEFPTESQCFTQKDGSFEIGTYLSKDGVPEGDYALTFRLGEWNMFNKSYEGDKLNGRYTDPKESAVKFTVTKGKPTELGEIKLTTH